jgi:hypothetical protein
MEKGGSHEKGGMEGRKRARKRYVRKGEKDAPSSSASCKFVTYTAAYFGTKFRKTVVNVLVDDGKE